MASPLLFNAFPHEDLFPPCFHHPNSENGGRAHLYAHVPNNGLITLRASENASRGPTKQLLMRRPNSKVNCMSSESDFMREHLEIGERNFPNTKMPNLSQDNKVNNIERYSLIASVENLARKEEIVSEEVPCSSNIRYYCPNLWKDDHISTMGDLYEDDNIQQLIEHVRSIFKNIEGSNGISASPYDTAWVARIPSELASDGLPTPRFPSTIDWLIQNQLEDGSWGHPDCFIACDRILNTLASVVTFKYWSADSRLHKYISRGVDFLWRNMELMQEKVGSPKLVGFEYTFPSLIEEAKQLGLDLPYDLPLIQNIKEEGYKKLQRISIDLLHDHPTPLLYFLEGLQKQIDWDKILHVQSKDGSFLGSPAATACAYIHTKDKKCLEFLNTVLNSYNYKCVPTHYPFDLVERLLFVDTLDRLGIDRFFDSEIHEALNYVYSFWNNQGIGWGMEAAIPDIGTTSMAFGILRYHNYDVSEEVFKIFMKDGMFYYLPEEDGPSCGVSDMINLYRASHMRFPNDTIMKQAKRYTKEYLSKILASGNVYDKRSIKKDLQGELQHLLRYTWHQTLPRIDARIYLDQYGTRNVFIAKTIYRMPYIHNEKILELAKADFNKCQAAHKVEMQEVTRWWKEIGLADLPNLPQRPMEIYFPMVAGLFDPKFKEARIEYSKATILVVAMDALADDPQTRSLNDLKLFVEFTKSWDLSLIENIVDPRSQIVLKVLHGCIEKWIYMASKLQGRDMSHIIKNSWACLVQGVFKEATWAMSSYIPSFEDYIDNRLRTITIGTLALTTFVISQHLTEEMIEELDFSHNSFKLICLTSALANDCRTFKAEAKLGEKGSAIYAYMKSNPKVKEDEALTHMLSWNEEILEELNWEFFKPRYFMTKFWREMAYYGLARAMNLFYMEIDGFRECHGDIKQLITKVLMDHV